MTNATSYLKHYSGPAFVKTFRSILYARGLAWGSKCYLLAHMDVSKNIKFPDKVVAKKLHVKTSQVYRWRTETRHSRPVYMGIE